MSSRPVLTHTWASRLGRYLLRDVDETVWTVAGTVLDAIVVPRVFDRCDICPEFVHFCWYAFSWFGLDDVVMDVRVSDALSHSVLWVRSSLLVRRIAS